MYRSVLALIFAAVLLLGGCAAGKQTVPKEKSGQETNMDGAAFDRSDEEITYLIYNDPLAYAELILNGEPEEYLRNVAGSHGLED